MKRIAKLVLLLSFLFTTANAEQGNVRIGVELGLSPVDMEAEDTAQKIANASGSTVTTEYSTGVLVGRIFADYGLSQNLYGEIGYFQTSGAEAKYIIGSDSATESYDAHGFDFSAKFISDEGLFGKIGMHSTTIDGNATVTIGSTTYSASGEAQGTGMLIGGGVESDGILYSVTRYNDVGGITDFTFFSVGYSF
jgi:hypothetical protein